MLPFLIPAIISAGASIFGGLLGKSSSNKAAQQQVDAQGKVIENTNSAVNTGRNDLAYGTGFANDILSQSADKQVGMYQPYVGAGQDSVRSIQQLAGEGGPLDQKFSFNPSDLQNDPGYAFALKQGQDAINRAAAAKGGLFSGATIKSLSGFGVGLADQTWNNAFARAKGTFETNRSTALSRIGTLQGLAGMGLSATAGSAGAVENTSGQIARNLFAEGAGKADLGMRGSETIGRALTSQGNSQAAGTVGGTNSLLSGITGAASSISNAGIMKFLMDRGVFGTGGGGYDWSPNEG